MKGFERRQIKKSSSLPLLHLTSSIFFICLSNVCLCLVLCCAGTTSVCSFDKRDGHAEVSVAEWSNFEFVFMVFKRLYKVICVGLCPETHSDIIDDEAEHDVSPAMPKEARGIRHGVCTVRTVLPAIVPKYFLPPTEEIRGR
jgi:hypothetical protein